MESEPKFFGKALTPDDRENANEYIEGRLRRGLERMDGEIEKTAEMDRFIEIVGGYLNQELELLDLEPFHFDLQRIHLLPPGDFEKEFKDSETNGVYRDLSDGIYLKNKESRMQLYKNTFHEMVHQASYGSFYADADKKNVVRNRMGYVSHHPTEENHEHFRGLNEAVVDNIVRDIFRKHKDELITTFNLSEAEQNEPFDWYTRYMDVLDVVVGKIAKKTMKTQSW